MDPVSLTGFGLNLFPLVLTSIKILSEYRVQTPKYIKLYGPFGALLFFLCSSDAWLLAEKILKTSDNKMVMNFVSAQIAQANMVAVTAGDLTNHLLALN